MKLSGIFSNDLYLHCISPKLFGRQNLPVWTFLDVLDVLDILDAKTYPFWTFLDILDVLDILDTKTYPFWTISYPWLKKQLIQNKLIKIGQNFHFPTLLSWLELRKMKSFNISYLFFSHGSHTYPLTILDEIVQNG